MSFVIQNIKENLYFRLCNQEYKQTKKDTFGILKNMSAGITYGGARRMCDIFLRLK